MAYRLKKKVRKLIHRFEQIIDGADHGPREIQFIQKKLKSLFSEYRYSQELIETFGAFQMLKMLSLIH